MEFEKENDIMDQRQEMMDDAIHDVTGLEDEEEGEEVVREVLDEIGIDLGQAVCFHPLHGEGPGLLDRDVLLLTATSGRWAKRLPAYRKVLLQIIGSLKPLVEAAAMTIYKLGWTV